MAVMAREEWTDQRLDDLNHRVDEGFKEMRTEFRAVRSEVQQEFRSFRAEMKGEFQAVRSEMGAFTRTVTQILWAIVGTIFLGFMGTIAALITLV
jgi:hypothetical protein